MFSATTKQVTWATQALGVVFGTGSLGRSNEEVTDIVEILMHRGAGGRAPRLARSLKADRGTVTKYTAKAKSEGYGPGGEQLSVQRWAEQAWPLL